MGYILIYENNKLFQPGVKLSIKCLIESYRLMGHSIILYFKTEF